MSAAPILPPYRGDFAEQTAHLDYTPDFHTALEFQMHDRLETMAQRIYAWIKRYSWGNKSWYAIKDNGTPRLQCDCAKELGIDRRRVSKVIRYLVRRGYLLEERKILYPIVTPQLKPTQEKVAGGGDFFTNPSPYFRLFTDEWKVAHSADWERREVARSVVKEVTKVLLSDYKKWQTSETFAEAKRRLKSVGSSKESSIQLASSASQPNSGTPNEPQTTRHEEIRQLVSELRPKNLPAEVGWSLNPVVIDRIDIKLQGVPIERLRTYAVANQTRMKTPAVLELFAEDVAKEWLVEQRQDTLRKASIDAEEAEKIREWRRMIAPDSGESPAVQEIARDCLRKRGLFS